MAVTKKYYSLEICYQNREETRMLRLVNLKPEFVRQIRENIFITGLYRRIDDDTGEIISPHWIRGVMLFRQAYFFGEGEVESMEKKGWQQVHESDIDNEKNALK